MRDYDHWIVWIGGVETDHTMMKDQADKTAQAWKDNGYDDVRIEKVYYEEGSWTA